MPETVKTEMWAVVELMGHDVTAGIIRPGELGGLLRIDVPIDNTFRTEYLGEGSIFRIRIVSEEIARAYAAPERGIISYDEPLCRALNTKKHSTRQGEKTTGLEIISKHSVKDSRRLPHCLSLNKKLHNQPLVPTQKAGRHS